MSNTVLCPEALELLKKSHLSLIMFCATCKLLKGRVKRLMERFLLKYIIMRMKESNTYVPNIAKINLVGILNQNASMALV